MKKFLFIAMAMSVGFIQSKQEVSKPKSMAANVPNFEIWNKSKKSPFLYRVDNEEASVIDFQPILPTKYKSDHLDLSKPTKLHIKLPHPDAEIYTFHFPKNKTLYVRIKDRDFKDALRGSIHAMYEDEFTFGPQTGKLQPTAGYKLEWLTERKYPLNKNVTDKEISTSIHKMPAPKKSDVFEGLTIFDK